MIVRVVIPKEEKRRRKKRRRKKENIKARQLYSQGLGEYMLQNRDSQIWILLLKISDA